MEIARLLHDTPDLFPWVVFAVIMALIFYERKALSEILRSMASYFKSKKENDILMVEVVRNNTATTEHNTAALNRNTEMLKTVMEDRRETREMVRSHEAASKERVDALREHFVSELGHIQTVVNRIDDTVTSNSRQIGLIEDRTDK